MIRAQANSEVVDVLRTKAEECRRALWGARQELELESTLEPLDDVSQGGQRQLAAERIELYLRTLRQVEAALGRVEIGSYGVCMRCEEAIGQKRLDALPWAPFCVECQAGADLLHDRMRAYQGEARRAA